MKKQEQMIRDIEAEVSFTRHQIGRNNLSPRVMQAMADVARHEFVPDDMKMIAYNNIPLPIGKGQTISQPYIVALMTDLLDPSETDTVLEIGSGSGYQAAVLSRLVSKVYSVEIVRELGEKVTLRLQQLGYNNVETRIGDGYYGWAEHAPYEGIIVTATSQTIPPPLLEQLAPGGRLVIPIGSPMSSQELVLAIKSESGEITTRDILPVAFVPLTGTHIRDQENIV